MFQEGLIAAEVYEDLKGSVEDRKREARPRFDLGLDTRELIGRLDLFADLSSYGPKVEGLTGTGLSSLKPKLLQISSFGAPISSFGKSVVANRCQAGRVVSVVAAHSCFEAKSGR